MGCPLFVTIPLEKYAVPPDSLAPTVLPVLPFAGQVWVSSLNAYMYICARCIYVRGVCSRLCVSGLCMYVSAYVRTYTYVLPNLTRALNSYIHTYIQRASDTTKCLPFLSYIDTCMRTKILICIHTTCIHTYIHTKSKQHNKVSAILIIHRYIHANKNSYLHTY